MKRPPAFLALLALLAACNSSPSTTTTDSTKTAAANDSAAMAMTIQSPYAITYSSKFAIDDPKNAESLLKIWKAYDDGNLASVKDLFADTMTANMADGSVFRASRDSTIAAVQAARNTLASVSDIVTAIMAVKATDKGDHWALIWGTETDTYKNGKKDSTDLQETWHFNNDGKADYFYQFRKSLKPPPPMKKKK